jgi:hypothetical protein
LSRNTPLVAIRNTRFVATVVAALFASMIAAGCRDDGSSRVHAQSGAGPSSTSGADLASTKRPSAPQVKTLTLRHSGTTKPVTGSEVDAIAVGLPPGRKVDLTWQTVNGGWVVEDYYHFRGKKFTETARPLGTAATGEDGRLAAHFKIPEDYGGVHEVTVSDNGVPLAQGGIEVSQTFEMHPTEGPVGTPIELRVKGLGWRTMDSTWVINWDNQEVGWVSATDTHGTAVARFRASGPVGEHQVRVYTGYVGQSYLNHEQAPNAYLPTPAFIFRIVPGSVAAPAYAEPYPKQPVPVSEGRSTHASLSVTPTQGPVLTRASLEASGLPANTPVSLVWGTHEGSRVSGNGFAPKETELSTLTVGAGGRLDASIAIPDDLGGLHTLSIRSGANTLARTYFVVETSVVSISPTSGPAGTPVTIHLKGVGWTDYDNIYVATYDNGYMGYACGFNSRGDVVVNFTAAGSPGVHLIDFYPGIYQGPEGSQQLYRLPQLTYSDDHPGNHIPALRFGFVVTPPPAKR